MRVKRWRGIYYHHGIDVGDGTVVHLSGEPLRARHASVCRETVEDFQDGHAIEIMHHEKPLRTGDAVAEEALAHVGESGYNIWNNNCEHFATYCVTGRRESAQITFVQKVLKVSATAAAGTLMVAGGLYAAIRARKKRSGRSLKG
jgi:hypothetical protein